MTADGTTGLGVLEWGQQCGALDVFADLKKVICGIDGETLDEGRFVRVLAGQDEGPPRIPRRQGRQQDTGYRTQTPGEGELPMDLQTIEQVTLELTGHAPKTPTAMGRSKRPPSLGKSAGAKLMVTRPVGNRK